jgi:hypothetical protein
LLLALPSSAWAGGNKEKDNNPQSQTQIQPVQQTIPQSAQQPASPYWTGDGGRGIRLAVLEPTGNGLSTQEQWVLSQVQGSITADFNRFSAITIIDRQNLEKILAEQTQSLSGNYSEQDYVRLGNLTNARLILAGTIRKTANNYMLELAVTDAESGERRASYPPKAVSLIALENNAAAREATAEMLKQLGVNLTAAALQELKTVENNTAKIQAENALARGITAQRQGTEVAALSYFFQAAAFDPTLAEAASRSSILTANITSGNIGLDARNDIQWRRDWIARLTETEQFFNNYFTDFFKNLPQPYTLYYTSNIKQIGEINYQNETLTLGGMEAALIVSPDWIQSVELVFRSMQSSVDAVLNGLNATRRKTVWGLDKWPEQNSFPLHFFRVQSANFTIIAELVNSSNQVIGRQTFYVSGTYLLPVPLPGKGEQKIQFFNIDKNTVNFTNIKVNDITDSLTIRIVSVNGTAADTAAKNGILQIQAVQQNEFNRTLAIQQNELNRLTPEPARNFIINNAGEITQYTGSQVAIIIPSTINGIRVTAIGHRVFQNKGLVYVTIPDSVTSIGSSAFSDNQLTSVTIPNSVTSIGGWAFSDNQLLTSVTIPNSITSIEDCTFLGCRSLISVTIPNSVTSIGRSAFDNCTSLTSITIPNSVTRIGDSAFVGCGHLNSVTIPNSVTNIGNRAFTDMGLSSGQPLVITIGNNMNISHSSLNVSFVDFYNNNGKKAGVYVYTRLNRSWSYSPQ